MIMAAPLIKPHILRQVNKGRVLINRVRVMCGGTVAYHGRKKQGVSIVRSDTKEMSVFTRQRRTLGDRDSEQEHDTRAAEASEKIFKTKKGVGKTST